MRHQLNLTVVGKNQKDIEEKFKKHVARYLDVDLEQVDVMERIDAELNIHLGEEGPNSSFFVASCFIRIK